MKVYTFGPILYSTLMATEPWGFLNNVPHIMWYGPTFIMVISEKTRDTLTCCRAFGNGATCFKDIGLSRPGIEPRSLACDANALPLRQRGNNIIQSIKKKSDLYFRYRIDCNIIRAQLIKALLMTLITKSR